MVIATHAFHHSLYFRLQICILALLFIHTTVAAGTLPWTQSKLLYDGSDPAISSWEILDIASDNDRLAVLTEEGVTIFALQDDQWEVVAQVSQEQPRTFAWVHQKLIVLTQTSSAVLSHNGDVLHTISEIRSEANHRSMIGAIPDTNQALIVSGWRTYVLDLNSFQSEHVPNTHLNNRRGEMTVDSLQNRLLAATRDGLYIWDSNTRTFTHWHDRQNQPLKLAADVNGLTFHPDGNLLYISTHGDSLITIDLRSVRIHHSTADNVPNWDKGKHIWRPAVDTKRDILYLPFWNNVQYLHPASDPMGWKQVGELTTTSIPSIHSNKDVGPKGGAVYLPQTDHLLIGTKWGVTTLATDQSQPFVKDEQFDQFRYQAHDIPGQGPLYEYMRQHKMRGIWASASVGLSEHVLDLFKRAQINTVLYQIFYINHDEFFPGNALNESLKTIAKHVAQRDMQLILVARPFGISAMNHSGIRDYDYRPMVLRSGEVGRYVRQKLTPRVSSWPRTVFPCPLDRGYWERSVVTHFVELAELANEVPITGVMYELGDAYTASNIRMSENEACLCDNCWANYWKTQPQAATDDISRLPAENWQRYRALVQQEHWQSYLLWQRGELAQMAREALDAARAIHPDFTAHLCLPETSVNYDEVWFYNAFIDGFGSPEHPALVLSQQTYGAPFTPSMDVYPGQRMAQRGQHAIFLPGIATIWHTPEQLAAQATQVHELAPGIWYYEGHSWEKGDDAPHFSPLTPARGQTFTVEDYVHALEACTFK